MTRKPPLPSWGYYVLGFLAGLGIGLSVRPAKAQDAPVALEVTASHAEAVAGQTVFVSWRPTKGSTIVTRCEFRQLPEGLPAIAGAATKTRTNAPVVMPDAPNLRVEVACFYMAAGVEASVTASDLIQRTTREAILAGTSTGPTCYPAPVGAGSAIYGASYRDEERRDAACVLWFCGDEPRSFCFRWDVVDWSIAGLAASKNLAGLDAKWTSAPWRATSERERALVAALFDQARPRYYAAPNGTYSTRPVYARKEDGTRGALVSTSRVAVGDECDCTQRAIYGTTRYCSVAGRANALRPGEVLPGPDTVSGGSFALCASR